ncbi:MAG TPA: efflux RND transporter periplasmic adaptor subunit [Candidatus Binatia bacterium]|nr:efflux RND transporter periplasmic adaptor subunit [Candidatus Binatia bacterium]
MKRFLWIGVLVLVLGGYAGFQQYSSWSLSKPQGKPTGQNDQTMGRDAGRGQARGGGRSREAIPVLVATAMQKSIPVQIRAVGNAEPYATVSVKSQVTGVLTKAHFKEGQDVKQGQLLFTIDPRPLEAAVKQAEANLARDTAQLKNLREQVRRYADLVEKQYVSREQYDQIRTNADAMESVVDADKAALENARVQLSYCYIYSPVNGRVGSLLVNEGNLVRVNDAAPLVVINQVSPMNVTFSVPEQHLADLKRRMTGGQLKVAASFPSDEGRPEVGVLEFVDNTVDRATGTIKLKAVFTNTEHRLWPGQFINVALTMTTEQNAVVIPSEAVQVGQEGQHVFVIKPDKTVEVRPVTLGTTSDGEAVIAKGLAAGEQVVKEGQFLLGPGSRIEIKDSSAGGDDTKDEGRERRGKSDGAKSDRKGEARSRRGGSEQAAVSP